MWIDTHCHLDAREFDPDRDAVVAQALAAGVNHIVVPAVARWNFDTVRALAHRHASCSYALGIHPLCAAQASDDDLAELRRQVAASMDDPRFVAIGEIGLDFFIPDPDVARQNAVYQAQLRIACVQRQPRPGATLCGVRFQAWLWRRVHLLARQPHPAAGG
jgi:TatD DNase family protein